MGKLFGTDGIRGVANETLTCRLAYRVGQAAAISLERADGKRPKVVIGKDTRISSDMLEAALLAGLTASGCDAVRLGVIPTPAVAYLTVHEQADAGIVISASHNPFEHNGIKMFSAQGFKLSDELEAEIEALILQKGELPARTHGEIGRIYDGAQLMDVYLDHLASTVDGLQPIKVVFDCANGAASATAKKLFSRFPLQAEYLSVSPDGVNINENCGSTHLERLSRAVREGGFQLGLAFDGDADRCLAVDENGCEIDGDQIMAVCAEYLTAQGKLQSEGFVATVMSNLGLHKFCEQQHLKLLCAAVGDRNMAICANTLVAQNKLRGGGFVATVMSNIGLHKYCEAEGLRLLCAAVGDRNVLELMQKEHMVLGGEQSGHIIFLEHMTTGDGQLAALQFLSILGESGKTASELAGQITHYPQVLRNVKVGSNEEKTAILNSRELAQATAREEVRLTGRGRILLRASGTEPLIRVMAEADTQDLAESVVKTLVEAVENVQKILKK